MGKEKDGIMFRILFWPLISMNDTIEKIHTRMDSEAPDDAFLEEDKRAIGIGGTFGGCIATVLWLLFLLVMFISALVMILIWIF